MFASPDEVVGVLSRFLKREEARNVIANAGRAAFIATRQAALLAPHVCPLQTNM